MIGILTEKPSAARNMATALGGSPKAMTGTFNGEQYLIVHARGHLFGFDKKLSNQVPPALGPQYDSWNINNLPWDETLIKWKYVKAPDSAPLLKEIKEKLSKCTEVCIATDVDPTGEGELLAWEVLDQLKVNSRKWSRMYFIDESVNELQKAFKTRKSIKSMIDDMDYIMAYYRSRWDYVSMQWTRLATALNPIHATLRQGRLKSAMVVLVGDQLKLLEKYDDTPFYQNRFKDENGVVYTNPKEPTYPNEKDVPKKYNTSPVTLDSKQMKSTPPPKLMDLAALSARLASKGYKAKVVQSTYQKMYEAQIVSYPRTEDKVITPEQFDQLLPLVNKIAGVVGVDTKYLTHRTARSTHVKTGGAHGANRPGPKVPASLAALSAFDEKGGKGCAAAIYELIATNYLAMLAEDYEYEAQKGHVTEYPDFTGTAQVPKKMGWKLVFNADPDDADDAGKGIGTVADPIIYKGCAPKPAAPTMKWLMKQLEKNDVGTGATRTTTYADVTDEVKNKYPLLKDTKGKITITEYGWMSYYLVQNTHIGSLEITKIVRQEMRDIHDGKKDPDVCLRAVQQMIKEDRDTMKKNSDIMRKEMKIMEKEKYKGTWNGEEVSFNRVAFEHRLTDDECEALCRGEEIQILDAVGKNGPFKCKGVLAAKTFKNKDGKDVPYVGFDITGFIRDESKSGIPRKWCEHTFTDEEMTNLEAGLSVERDDWFSKNKNKKFKATIKWNPDEKKFDFV